MTKKSRPQYTSKVTLEQFHRAIAAAAETAIELRDIDPRAAAMALYVARAWERDMRREFGD